MAFGMVLHRNQAKVFKDKSRYRALVAGRRFGKTVLAAAELLREAAKPRRIVWYVAPTYRMAKQIMWVDLIERIPKQYVIKSNETAMEIYLINGSRICLRGADNPDTLRGVGLNFLVIDEVQDVKPEVWEKILRPTLAKDRGRALFIGTPKAFNFLYDLYQKGQNLEQAVWNSWQFPTMSSPYIPKDEIEQARKDMDPRTFRQEFEASFESVAGRVYYNFDRRTHVGTYGFNPALPIWVGQDFNITPMSSVIIQRQPNGELWVVDEIYLSNSNTSAVCDELERRYWRHKHNLTLYPDPAGANRQSGRGESDLDIFRTRGFKRLKYRRQHPAQADRINSVNKMLMSADGKIHLRVDAKCKNLITSLEQTLFAEDGYGINKKLKNEHITDALGYCVEFEYPRRKFKVIGVSI